MRRTTADNLELFQLIEVRPKVAPPSATWQDYVVQLLVAITVLAVISAIVFFAFLDRAKVSYDTCTTPSCRMYADLFVRAIEPNIDACDNFYGHVCSRWDLKESQSVYEAVLKEYVDIVSKRLLTTAVPPTKQNATQKVAKFFQSCMSVTAGDASEIEQIRGQMQKAGVTWPQYASSPDVLYSMMYVNKVLGYATLMSISLAHHPPDVIFVLLSPNSGLSWITTRRNEIIKANEYSAYYKRMIGYFASDHMREVGFQEFKYIEDEVIRALSATNTGGHQARYINISTLERLFTPSLRTARWQSAVRRVFSEIPRERHLVFKVTNTKLLGAIDHLIASLGEQKLHMYVGWLATQQFPAALNRDISSAFSGGATETKEGKRLQCLLALEKHMGWLVHADAAEAVERPAVREDVRRLVSSIWDAMEASTGHKIHLETIDRNFSRFFWIRSRYQDISFLNTVYEKYSDMGPYMPLNWMRAVKGYKAVNTWETEYLFQSYLGEYVLHPSGGIFRARWDWKLDAVITDLIIRPHHVVMPMYDRLATAGIKYGTLGTIMAEELAWSYLNMSDTPSLKALGRLSPRLNCKDPSQRTPSTPFSSTMQRTVIQDILWDAFRKNASGKDVRLEGLTRYTEAATFYLAQCFILCGLRSQDNAQHRCNEPLKHSRNFAETMACPEGSPMNPGDKCLHELYLQEQMPKDGFK